MKINFYDIKEEEKKEFKKFYKGIKKESIEKQKELFEQYERNRHFSITVKDDSINLYGMV